MQRKPITIIISRVAARDAKQELSDERLKKLTIPLIDKANGQGKYKAKIVGFSHGPALNYDQVSIDSMSGNNKIVMRIKEAGQVEWWRIELSLTEDAKSGKSFFSSFRKAANSFTEESKAKYLKTLESKGDKKDRNDTPPPPPGKRKIKRSTSKIINDEVAFKLIRQCLKASSANKLDMRQFRGIISELNIDCNPLVAISFLEKRGWVKSQTPVPRMPQITILDNGLKFYQVSEERFAAAEKCQESIRLLQLIRKETTPLLALMEQLDEATAEITETQKMIETTEKALEQLRTQAKEQLAKRDKLLGSLKKLKTREVAARLNEL